MSSAKTLGTSTGVQSRASLHEMLVEVVLDGPRAIDEAYCALATDGLQG